jgi:PhoPQ-activated pathogenicity-related protein
MLQQNGELVKRSHGLMKVMDNLKSDTNKIATTSDIAKNENAFHCILRKTCTNLIKVSKVANQFILQHCPDGKRRRRSELVE